MIPLLEPIWEEGAERMDSEGEEEADLVVDPMVEEETHSAVADEVTLAEEGILAEEETSAEEAEIDTMTGEAVEEGGMTVDRGADRHRGVYLALIREVGVHRDESRNGMNANERKPKMNRMRMYYDVPIYPP